MATIRWLHLSDFHAGKDSYGERKMFDRIRAYVRREADRNWVPDFIVISGDLAFSGRPEQYALIKDELIEPLVHDLAAYPWSGRVYSVPGNHDVDRTADYATRESILAKSKNLMRPTEDGRAERKGILGRFAAYHDACSHLTGPDGNDWLQGVVPAFVDRLEIDGAEVGVAGINTAWLSEDDHDRNKLRAGYDLVEESLKKLSGCSIKLLIGHHPIGWLDDNDAALVRKALAKHNAIYLHGHLHKAEVERQVFRHDQFLTVQSAAGFQAHDHEVWVNGFVQAEANTCANVLRLQAREWNPHNDWVYAAQRFHADDADMERPMWFRFDLPTPSTGGPARVESVAASPTALPTSTHNAVALILRLNAQELVSMLLSGAMDAALLAEIAADEEHVASCLRGLSGQATEAWQRLVFADISARAGGPPGPIMDLAFDGSLHWGARTQAITCLRFVKQSDRPDLSEALMAYGTSHNIDNQRLAISGFGYLGDLFPVTSILENEDVDRSRYHAEKLGPYALWSALSAISLYSKSPHFDYFIWSLKEANNIVRRAFYETNKFDVYFRLLLLPKIAAPILLDEVIALGNQHLLEGVLMALDGRCSPYSLDALLAIARDPSHGDFARGAALRAVASLASLDAVEATAGARDEGLVGAREAHCLAIGWYRDTASADKLLEELGGASNDGEVYLGALWSAGQLAPDVPALIPRLREASKNPKASVARALGWLGLAKAGQASPDDLRGAAELATSFVEELHIGVAGLLAGEPKLLEAGIHASQQAHQPIWMLQGQHYADLRRGLAQNAGEPGRLMLSLLDRGDLK